MNKEWSRKWIGSAQVRKQRKYRHNAPMHVRHELVSSHLAKELRKQYKRRSFPVRKGDEVEIMRGKFSGTKGIVERVDMRRLKVYVEGAKVKKTEGREVVAALEPSNLKITRLNLDDKRRQAVLMKQKKQKTPVAGKKEMPAGKVVKEKKSEEKTGGREMSQKPIKDSMKKDMLEETKAHAGGSE